MSDLFLCCVLLQFLELRLSAAQRGLDHRKNPTQITDTLLATV